MKHAIERTSPKGKGCKFVGTCVLCGATGLPASAALEDCPNVRGLNQDEALVETILGEQQERAPHWPLPSFDAVDWAKEFMRLFGERRQDIDEELMIGWFANALMRGYDEHQWRTEGVRVCDNCGVSFAHHEPCGTPETTDDDA